MGQSEQVHLKPANGTFQCQPCQRDLALIAASPIRLIQPPAPRGNCKTNSRTDGRLAWLPYS